MRPLTVIPIAIFAVIAAVFGVYLWQVGPGGKDISQLPSAMIDKPAPQFDLPGIAGAPGEIDTLGLKAADLKGKVSLVNVWASWCPPCRIEHPILMTLAKEGVTIYGINYKDKPADARRFLAELGNPFKRIGVDNRGRAAIDWGVYGYPETFIVDASGRIRYRHVGPINPGQVDSIIRPLLKKAAQASGGRK
ncbi:MAG: DsbE family thiol:disulfide interchange protein [Proteobacteria bacterium]|nr:DsbE family thiol:disulfide interchange protein [Pseudomonadota bacterium]